LQTAGACLRFSVAGGLKSAAKRRRIKARDACTAQRQAAPQALSLSVEAAPAALRTMLAPDLRGNQHEMT
jgi:hypothetical protein